MRYGDGSHYNEPKYLSLLGVLIGGILVVFNLSPDPILTRINNIMLPLAVLLGLILLLLQSKQLKQFNLNLDKIANHGWMGASVSGIIGAWWVAPAITQWSSIIPVCDQVLTVISLGIGAGVIFGGFPMIMHLRTPEEETNQRPVLAESTWTQRSGPDQILVEVVEQIADLEGVDPCELEPLKTYIDPDVFSHLQADGESTWQVLFHTAKYEVRVNSQGTVTVYDIDWMGTAAKQLPNGEPAT
ncbi:MAG TPA: HalOD1 output domain-containing protein [Halobacteriales archaeon]|nr:HalOD1 output domain-containing protein [Halobacteriales archaeon]